MMRNVIKSSACKVLYLVLCGGMILLLSSCFFRPIEDATPDESGGTVHVRVRWGKYSKPEGEWLVFYPENRSLKSFSREVSDDSYIDDLLPGKYKLLLLGMDKADPGVQFCTMNEPDSAKIELLKPSVDGNVGQPQMMFFSIAEFEFSKENGQLVVLSPFPLVLKTCFEMPTAPGRMVTEAEARLFGLVNSIRPFTMEATKSGTEEYFKLTSVYKEGKVCFEGKILLPLLHSTLRTRAESDEKTILKMDLTYDNGEKETIISDVTQAIQEVAAEGSSDNVTFNLLKIGATATVVSWIAGTGYGEVN